MHWLESLFLHMQLLEMQSHGLGSSPQIQAALLTYLDLTEGGVEL